MLTLSLLALIILPSCTTTLANNRFYADAGPAGAFYFDSFDKTTGLIPKTIWDANRQGMVCETTSVFTNLKDVIEQLCANSHACTYDQQQQENAFMSRLQDAESKIK